MLHKLQVQQQLGPHQVHRPRVACLNAKRIVHEPLMWVVELDVVQDVITRPVDIGTQTQTRSCQLVCGYQYYKLVTRFRAYWFSQH